MSDQGITEQVDERFQILETKVLYQDRIIDDLNEVVTKQQDQMDRLTAKMEQLKTGGTLLNMKFTPQLLDGETGIKMLASLVRGYFKMDGHHMQLNVVTAETLREAQADPDNHRDLIVRVAGYSDYFCDISRELQDEIILRTEHKGA